MQFTITSIFGNPNLVILECHLSKRHPVAYMPCDVGPRNCVGMRFVLIELKMGLACLLHTYIHNSIW
jgi:cytochrome P450